MEYYTMKMNNLSQTQPKEISYNGGQRSPTQEYILYHSINIESNKQKNGFVLFKEWWLYLGVADQVLYLELGDDYITGLAL